MARIVKKDRKINYTKKEFLREYNISENNFKDNIDKVLKSFDIEKAKLKRDDSEDDEKTVYEIRYEIAGLLSVMFKNYKRNPFYDNRSNTKKKSFEDIIEYNNNIINDVEKMPNYIKYLIKKQSCYRMNFELTKLMSMILKKLSVLFYLILTVEKRNIGETLGGFVQDIDILISKYSREKLIQEWKNENLFPEDKKNHYSYRINDSIKFCFEKVLDESKITKGVIDKISTQGNKLHASEEETNKLREFYLDELNKIYLDKDKWNEIEEEYKTVTNNLEEIENFELNYIKEIRKSGQKGKVTLKEKLLNKFLRYMRLDNFTYGDYYNGIDLSIFAFKLKEEVQNYDKNIICKDCCFLKNKIDDDIERFKRWEKCKRETTKCGKLKKLADTLEVLEKEIIELDEKSYDNIRNEFNQKENEVAKVIKDSLSLSLGQIIVESMEHKKI
ncbi:hypothetical protein [Clostridium sp. C2-6-12]|uniref:hypothetical protein n=1 Tax=Clostridium sp. C2-6-12 TaxID=2698832 RepID=UPI001368877E|nr:hypothetical protein [Clostridium sp. C2-6-12]